MLGILTFHLQPFDKGVITASVWSCNQPKIGNVLLEFSNNIILLILSLLLKMISYIQWYKLKGKDMVI